MQDEAAQQTATSEAVEAVRFVINSSAWRDFFVPMLEGARESAIIALMDPSVKRKDSEPDDFLRGRVNTITALLGLGPALVAETDAIKDQAEAAKAVADEYQARAESGNIGPFGR